MRNKFLKRGVASEGVGGTGKYSYSRDLDNPIIV